MSDVKRYRPEWACSGDAGAAWAYMQPDAAGGFVHYEDHEAALKAAADEVTKLRGLVGRLKAAVCDVITTDLDAARFEELIDEAEEALR